MANKIILIGFCFLLLLFESPAFAQESKTDHYRFAKTFDMGLGEFDDGTFTTICPRIWTFYNTDKNPAIDVQEFFDNLIQEQNLSGIYLNDKDINLEVYLFSIESDDEKMLIDFLNANKQNIAIMSVVDVPMDYYTMVYKIDGVWYILFFNRIIDMSKF